MAINAIQAAIRSMTGTEWQFNGDLHAYWDQLGIPPGQFAERMVAWKQLPQNAAWIAATEDADAPEGVDGLWRNGEQGVWYDPSDLSTMYQDATGTTPVYMPGQGQIDPPVGLLLDKRLGLTRGPERLTNGSFSAGAAGWAVTGADATHIATFAGGKVRYQSDTTSPALTLSQAAAGLVPDSYYEILITLSSWVSGSLKTDSLQPLGTAIGLQFTFSGVGTYRFVGKAIASNFGILRAVTNVDLTIDSISIKELSGNHAFQPSTPSRPALSARYNLLTKTEDFSVAAAWPTEATGTGSAPVCTARYATAPDGTLTATRLQLSLNGGTAAADRSGVAQTVAAVTQAASYKGVIWLKATTPADIGKTVLLRHVGGTNYYPCVLTANWKAFERVEAAATSYGVFVLGLRGASGGASDSVDILVWGADLRAVTDGVGLPPYQRVVDANTYDTAGFPPRLRFDGVDDFFQTASVDFTSTNKIFVGVGARKLADTATGLVLELSTSVGATNPGSFALYTSPNAAAQVGAIAYITGLGYKYAPISAPATYVQSVQFDASLPVAGQMDQRINKSAVVALSGGDIGAGNFGNYAMYMGRRGAGGSPFAGYISQVIVCGKRLSAAGINAVEKLINSKARAF